MDLFARIPYGDVEQVIAACPIRALEPGEVLLEPGSANRCVYLLVSGELEVWLGAEDAHDSVIIGPGSSIGELSIIDGEPVSARVVASAASEVVTIDEGVFWSRLVPLPEFARNLARTLARRMRAGNERVVARLRERLAYEHLQKELRIAADIQLSLLPARGALFAERPEIEIYGLMDPVRDVGGDLYDVFPAGPERMVFAVGDVSGKGVPAAMFMARAVTHLRSEASRSRPIAHSLGRINRLLCDRNEAGMFVTLLIGVLDLASGEFVYTNAGHNPPLLGRDGAFHPLPVPKGLVAGVMEGAVYGVERALLRPGDIVLLYTDGVTEALNPRGEELGETRLVEMLDGEACAATAVERVRAGVGIFAAGSEQSDDITLLALRWLGAGRASAGSLAHD